MLEDSHQIGVQMEIAKSKEQRNEIYNRRSLNIELEELTEPLNKWTELDHKVQGEIKYARLELVQEFRKLIGVK